MNFSTIAMLLLVWQLLSPQNGASREQAKSKPDIKEFLSDETNNMIDCVGKLSSQKSSNDDKMGALFQIVSNPTVMNLVGNLFPQNGGAQTEKNTNSMGTGVSNFEQTASAQEEFSNTEGYRFEEPSKESREFFRPIDNIADAEVKSKLYWFYDNWYIK